MPTLAGGLSFRTRSLISGLSLALAIVLALAFRPVSPELALSFFFPSLMMAGLFGGAVLSAVALAVSVLTAAFFFTGISGSVLFFFALLIQTGLALGMRALFRESRRWGVRYRRLIDAVTAAVVISDRMGQIRQPQPEFEKLVGMAWPEYAGFGWLKAVHPDDLKIAPGEPGVRDNILRRTIRLRDPKTNDWRWFQFRSISIPGRDGAPEEMISALFDVHRQRLQFEQSEIQVGELRHRWKNMMAVITSLATSSQPDGDEAVEAYVKKLLGRLNAFAAAGDQAIAGGQMIDIGGVLNATLAPFAGENPRRIVFDGPSCFVSEETGAALALAAHELATNAIKYGALSASGGWVSVRWTTEDFGKDERVAVEWTESGGPPASEPNREGFGMRVIRFVPARERNGKVDLDFRAEGLLCRITFLREKPSLPPG